MNRIFFCGDPHGQFRHVIEAVREHRPAAVVLLGDLEAQRPLEIELADILPLTDVRWICGNHDTDSIETYQNLFDSKLADRNLHGRVVRVAAVRIAGLGGIFRGQVWRPPDEAPICQTADEFIARTGRASRWRGGLPLKHRTSIFPEDVERLAKLRADVLVTHEAPSCHHFGFAVIDDLARSLEVSKAFHGHHHEQRDYSDAKLGFAAYSVGFRGITDLDRNVVLE